MALLPPYPQGAPANSGFIMDWYEKMRTIINQVQGSYSWSLITGKPTTLGGYGITDPVELTTAKGMANGYAALSSSSRVPSGTDTIDDVIVDSITTGLVLKSPNGHYWRATISNLGVVTWTDLGTTKP